MIFPEYNLFTEYQKFPTFDLLQVTGSRKPGKYIMPVNNSDNAVPVNDREPAHIMLHQQFSGRADRFIRTDSDDILGHHFLDCRVSVVGYHRLHPPCPDQIAPGN